MRWPIHSQVRPERGGLQREPDAGGRAYRAGCPSRTKRGWRAQRVRDEGHGRLFLQAVNDAGRGGARGARSIASIDSTTRDRAQRLGLGRARHLGAQALAERELAHALAAGAAAGRRRRAFCGAGVAHHLVDRDEAGVLREQAVAQAQVGDALALARRRLPALPGRDRPAMRWRAHRLRSAAASWRACGVDLQFLAIRALGAAAFDHDAAARFAAPLAEHDHRALAEHVGQLPPARRRRRRGLRSAP